MHFFRWVGKRCLFRCSGLDYSWNTEKPTPKFWKGSASPTTGYITELRAREYVKRVVLITPRYLCVCVRIRYVSVSYNSAWKHTLNFKYSGFRIRRITNDGRYSTRDEKLSPQTGNYYGWRKQMPAGKKIYCFYSLIAKNVTCRRAGYFFWLTITYRGLFACLASNKFENLYSWERERPAEIKADHVIVTKTP